MPHVPLKLIPGVNTARTPLLLEAGYQYASNVRFARDGLPEKIGGWVHFFDTAVEGEPRALHAWQDLEDVRRLAVATDEEVSVIALGEGVDIPNGVRTVITPQIFTSEPAEDFSTTNGSATVTVVDSNLTGNVTVYDAVHIKTPIAVGGLILSGVYQIASRVDGTTYTITAASNATADVSNGGAVPTLQTTADSDRVTVGLAAHGLAVGDTFVLPTDETIGGIALASGVYEVASVPTADTFTIVANAAATSNAGPTSINGGSAHLDYYIALGPDIVTGAGIGMVGFGALGQYALGDGSPVAGTVLVQQTGTAVAADDWTLENWGEILIACPCVQCDENYAGIWYWQPDSGFQTMRLMTEAPLYNTGIFLSQPAQILVAYGSTANEDLGLSHDPLLVRWCDQQDFTDWTASATNYAGSFRIPSGSRLVGGLSTRQIDLLWTDLDLWAMRYLGGQGTSGAVSLVFGFDKIGSNCGLIAKHAAVSFRNTVFWMGKSNFFRLGGNGVEVIPCTVWDAVFQDLDEDNVHKCWAQSVTAFDEIEFHYPSASGGTGSCDKVAVFNVLNGTWRQGPRSGDTSTARSAGIDQSVLGGPIKADKDGMIYQHESGYDAVDSAISWSWETGEFEIAEGQEHGFVDLIVPDFKYGTFAGSSNASISITLKGRNYPGETQTEYGPYTATSVSTYISPRFRHKMMSIKVSGSDSGTFSRLGQIRIRYRPDGRHP